MGFFRGRQHNVPCQRSPQCWVPDLRNINPIKYSFKDIETGEVTDPRKRYGFSAQEILALEGDDPIIVNTQNPDNYGITHDHIIPILVNAIKELDAENKSILARLEALENPV